MRLEIVPLIVGILVALVALGLILDGWVADETFVSRERRRRPRIERNRAGEVMLGFGTLAMAAAFLGRDTFRYSILIAMIGAPLLLVGAWKNRRYMRDWLFNRGAARRGQPVKRPEPRETRIR